MGDDVETRELRYFVAVAEELHFGRAAERLGIAQPPLSRTIRLLERRIGVTLLERTSRAVRLTAPGEVMLIEARRTLVGLEAAVRRTRRAAEAPSRLTLVLKAGGDAGLLGDILERYARSPRAVPVDLAFSAGERAEMVRDGRADLALLHRPQNDLNGLDYADLQTEGQVALMHDSHPLSQHVIVSMADLGDEPTLRWPESRPGVGDYPVTDAQQVMQLVRLKRLVAVVPASAGEQLPPGMTSRPVHDAVPATLVLAWSQLSTSTNVADFVRAACAV